MTWIRSDWIDTWLTNAGFQEVSRESDGGGLDAFAGTIAIHGANDSALQCRGAVFERVYVGYGWVEDSDAQTLSQR